MLHLRSSSSRFILRLVLSLVLLVLLGGVVAGCGSSSERQLRGKWEVVERAGDISQKSVQLLPTKIGGEIELLRKGDLKITGSDINYGPWRYSFPDSSHLQIEGTSGLVDVVEFSLTDKVLSLSDGVVTLTLRPYEDLDRTPANLVGSWSIPDEALKKEEDSIVLGGAVSGILSGLLGGETKQDERCLVTDRREADALGNSSSYSPTVIRFGSDKTLTLLDRFDTTWQGQFDVANGYLSISAEKVSQTYDGVTDIQASCQITQLTNAKLVLNAPNGMQIEYVRSATVAETPEVDAATPTIVRLTPSPSIMQGDWMIGGGGNGGIRLYTDGTADVIGWGLGAGVTGMYAYPATYRVEDNRLSIALEEIPDTSGLPEPPITDMAFTIVELTENSLMLQGDQIMTAFNMPSPLRFFRPY